MEPLFSATPRIPRDPAPGESHHPSSFTGRLRRFLLKDGEALFTAQERQADYLQAEADAPVPSRD